MTTTHLNQDDALTAEIIPALQSLDLTPNDYDLHAVAQTILTPHEEDAPCTLLPEFNGNPAAIAAVAKKHRHHHQVKRATVTCTTWQGDVKATVQWRPETLHGFDASLDNVGLTPIAWADEPPIYLAANASHGGTACLYRNPARVNGLTFFPARADDDAPYLAPGEFQVVSAHCNNREVTL